MRKYLFLCLCFLACSNSGDGPLNAFDETKKWYGDGFYLGAELSLGRKAHSTNDTLPVELKNIWVQSHCYWDSINGFSEVQDNLWHLSFRIPLVSSADINCATAQFFDTTLLVAPAKSWENIEKIIIWGADTAVALSLEEPELSFTQKYEVVLDSVFLLAGENQDSSFSVVLDSTFLADKPVLQGENPWVYRYTDTLSEEPQRFTFWVEKLPSKSFYNRTKSNFLGNLRLEFWRELFVCEQLDSLSELCQAQNYAVWDLENNEEVLDSEFIAQLVQQIGLEGE